MLDDELDDDSTLPCSICGRESPPLSSVMVADWGEGGAAAYSLGERDPLMLGGMICPDCAEKAGSEE